MLIRFLSVLFILLFSTITLYSQTDTSPDSILPAPGEESSTAGTAGEIETAIDTDDLFNDSFSLDDEDLDEDLASILDDPFTVDEDDSPEDISAFIDDPFRVDDDETAADTENIESIDLGADDEMIDLDDLDSMFQDDMFEEIDQTTQNTAPQEDLLKEEGVRWGGRFRGSADSSWDWDLYDYENNSLTDPASVSINPTVAADLFFNARPESDFRIFGKLKIESGTESAGFSNLLGFTLTQDASGNFIFGTGGGGGGDAAETPDDEGSDTDPDQPPAETDVDIDTNEVNTDSDYNSDDPGLPQYDDDNAKEEEKNDEEAGEEADPLSLSVSVFELFSDFNWNDTLFFRFGKHTIKWGVGYFWSPSDVLNLTPIDTEDPTAEREGPISLKTHFPFKIHNAYLYLIANQASKPLDLAVAPKVEFVIGTSEIGIGAFYQRDLAPRLVGMIKTSVSDFDLFGEVTASYGSDKIFVRKSRNQAPADESQTDDLDLVLETYADETSFFFTATAGALYTNSDWNLNLMAQYLFNGEGYSSSEMLEPAYYLYQNTESNGLYIAGEEDRPDDYEDPPQLGTNDLSNFGMHYAALSLSFSELFGNEDIGLSCFVLANLCDLSGIISPSVSFQLFDRFNLSLNLRTTFGDEGDEYTNPAALAGAAFGTGDEEEETYKGPTLSLSFNVSLGGGSF